VKWQERQVKDIHSRMRRVVAFLVRDLKIRLNVMKRSKGPRGGTNYAPSLPGQYPRKRSGELQRQVAGKVVRKGNTEVGGFLFDTVDYAKYLEGGLRPFLLKNVKENIAKIRSFLFKKT